MTTLRLKNETKEKLYLLKKEFNAKSYDELLEKMIKETKKKISMFGKDPELKEVTKDEIRKLRTDRY